MSGISTFQNIYFYSRGVINNEVPQNEKKNTGKNVCGEECIWGRMYVGKMYMGKNVCGEECMWGRMYIGKNVCGEECGEDSWE